MRTYTHIRIRSDIDTNGKIVNLWRLIRNECINSFQSLTQTQTHSQHFTTENVRIEHVVCRFKSLMQKQKKEQNPWLSVVATLLYPIDCK